MSRLAVTAEGLQITGLWTAIADRTASEIAFGRRLDQRRVGNISAAMRGRVYFRNNGCSTWVRGSLPAPPTTTLRCEVRAIVQCGDYTKRLIAPVLLLAVIARAQGPCPPPSMNAVVGIESKWTGDLGGRVVRCNLCASVITFVDFSDAMITGWCRMRHRHRRVLLYIFASHPGGPGNGLLCRGPFPPGPPSPLPSPCCQLTVPAVTFDAGDPPDSLNGDFICTQSSGRFSLTRALKRS